MNPEHTQQTDFKCRPNQIYFETTSLILVWEFGNTSCSHSNFSNNKIHIFQKSFHMTGLIFLMTFEFSAAYLGF